MLGKLFKKKNKESSKKTKVSEKEAKELKRKNSKQTEVGGRWSSVTVLLVTVLLSLGFYFYGVVSGSRLAIDDGDTWEFEKNPPSQVPKSEVYTF